jgi:site-specific recombinase XerD
VAHINDRGLGVTTCRSATKPRIAAGCHRLKLSAQIVAGLAGLRVHHLRHAHASWLLAGGADLQVVKERLGHASIVATERYLHSLPTADETALDALVQDPGPQLARPA